MNLVEARIFVGFPIPVVLNDVLNMRSQHIKMPIEEFEVMSWKLGWKYEYWDGQAHISPRESVVTVRIEVEPRPVASDFTLQPVGNSDESAMVEAFMATFRDTIEYCDWPEEKILAAAQKNIRNFLDNKRGPVLPASRLAVAHDPKSGAEYVIGAALLLKKKSGHPLLDMLFVVPAWQHQGLGTALVSAAVNDLHLAGFMSLQSRYVLGNEASRAWHRKFGFVEEPDLTLTRIYYHHAHHECWRREKLGDLEEAEHQKLIAEEEYWNSEVEKLQKIAEEQGFIAVAPLLWE